MPSSFSSCSWLRYCSIFSCSSKSSSLLLKPSFSKREESLFHSSRVSSISATFCCSSKDSSFKIQFFATESFFSKDSSPSVSSLFVASIFASFGANPLRDFSSEDWASSASKRERLIWVFFTSPKRPEYRFVASGIIFSLSLASSCSR